MPGPVGTIGDQGQSGAKGPSGQPGANGVQGGKGWRKFFDYIGIIYPIHLQYQAKAINILAKTKYLAKYIFDK